MTNTAATASSKVKKIDTSIFEFDLSAMKTFTPKNGKFTAWDVKSGEPTDKELSAEQFTLVIYSRSQEAANNSSQTEIEEAANKYFIDQIADDGDPDMFTLMLSPFAEWNTIMEQIGFAHISRDSVKAAFIKAEELIKAYQEEMKAKEAAGTV